MTPDPTHPVCPHCGGPLVVTRKGPLYVGCATGCPVRRLRTDGVAGPDAVWAAVATDRGRLVLVAAGGESACWDALLRFRRGGMTVFLCPLSTKEEAI
jgi:hypothetical protein